LVFGVKAYDLFLIASWFHRFVSGTDFSADYNHYTIHIKHSLRSYLSINLRTTGAAATKCNWADTR